MSSDLDQKIAEILGQWDNREDTKAKAKRKRDPETQLKILTLKKQRADNKLHRHRLQQETQTRKSEKGRESASRRLAELDNLLTADKNELEKLKQQDVDDE